ncbi:hypothetical protein ACRDU6_17325 [Mycolicibacterium sp. ELW1]|uniref:hypothetical protein n=1 Tax=Mycobacteriaceae TaxID=1762 RepID=UPI0011EDD288|nr:hypothetical protein [Mycobacterium sp. ELW1]QEN14192.1 hypothetical protein D3H54_13885 [Mycobacterium sp. ELW1]
MHTAIRSYATAGVALLGAGAIAMTPVSPVSDPFDVAAQRISNIDVGLVALVDPITAYSNLVTHTVASLTGLANEIAADPLPILRAMLANGAGNAQLLGTALNQAGAALTDQLKALPAALQTTITQLRDGQVSDAIVGLFGTGTGLLLGPALPLIGGVVPVIQNMVANYNDVIQNALPLVLASVALTPIYPINATVSAFAALAQNVVDSISSRDITSVVEDFVSAPAVLTDAFLNGFPGGPTAFIDPAGGLLSGATVGFGTVENLLQAAKAIAAQLTRPGPPASLHLALPHLLPKASAATVTLAPVVTKGVAGPAHKAASNTSSTGHAKAQATSKGTAGSKRTAKSGR